MQTDLPNLTFNDLPEIMGRILQKMEQMEQAFINLKSNNPNGGSMENEVMLTLNQAAKYMGCSKTTLHRLKSSGVIPYHQAGRILLFKASELDEATLVPAISYEKKK